MTARVLGIDLSYTGGLGLCLVPSDWVLDFRRVLAVTLKPPENTSHPEKIHYLVEQVLAFARYNHATEIWHEGYAIGGRNYGIHLLAQVGGALTYAFLEQMSLEVQTAHMSSARKTFCGKLPQGKGMAKKTVKQALKSLGAGLANDNECDAFVVANHALSLGGHQFMTGTP